MNKKRYINYLFAGISGLFLLGFSSCKTTKVATTTAIVRPISSNKLMRNIENNAFDYKHLSIKKINCQFDNGKTKTSFRASIQAEKDKRITILLSKLNIPVGRLWLTPDSVKFINYIEKNYFIDDYAYLSSTIDMDIDFETIHAIISNNVFMLRNENENPDFQVMIDSGMYVLQSEKILNTEKLSQNIRDRKAGRKSRKVIKGSPVEQTLLIDPNIFKIRKIALVDALNSRNLRIDFSDFTEVEKQLYPADINLHFISPESRMELGVKMSNFSMEEENEIRFKIPDKFTRINRK